MRPLALLAALVAAPLQAQAELPAAIADRFTEDVRLVTRAVATAALVHDATGAFPTTAFALLGSEAAAATDLRRAPLSALGVTGGGDRLQLDLVPLPVAPYVREDDVVRVLVTRDADGLYHGRYEVRRRADPDDGGARIAYAREGTTLATRGYGTVCLDVEAVRGRLLAGEFDAEPGTFGPTAGALGIALHPADDEPTLFEDGR